MVNVVVYYMLTPFRVTLLVPTVDPLPYSNRFLSVAAWFFFLLFLCISDGVKEMMRFGRPFAAGGGGVL